MSWGRRSISSRREFSSPAAKYLRSACAEGQAGIVCQDVLNPRVDKVAIWRTVGAVLDCSNDALGPHATGDVGIDRATTITGAGQGRSGYLIDQESRVIDQVASMYFDDGSAGFTGRDAGLAHGLALELA